MVDKNRIDEQIESLQHSIQNFDTLIKTNEEFNAQNAGMKLFESEPKIEIINIHFFHFDHCERSLNKTLLR